MATTCKLIAKSVLGSDTADITFSSIPATYTDLLLIASARSAYSGQLIDSLRLQFNGDTGSNYSVRWMQGDGSAASSGSSLSLANIFAGYIAGPTTTASAFSSVEICIPNYAGSTNKSVSTTSAHETNGSTAYIIAGASLWSDTSAINSIKAYANNANLVSGSSFFLYGITKS